MKALGRTGTLAKAACCGEEMRVQSLVVSSLHLNNVDVYALPNTAGFWVAPGSRRAGRTSGLTARMGPGCSGMEQTEGVR